MKYFLSLLVLCSGISFNTAAVVLTNSVEEHYWRDWRGLIPSDAIPAGTNHDGETTYIGQMSVRVDEHNTDHKNLEWNGLDFIPAVLTHRNDTAIAPYWGKTIYSNRNSNVKVLCSASSRNYLWHTEPSVVGAGCRYVVAGQEGLVPMYIGRAVVDKQTLFGKIFSDGRGGKPLIVPYKGGELVLENYDTLTYCK